MIAPQWTVRVCTSSRPKIHGGGCCNDKGGDNLYKAFEAELAQRGLSTSVELLEAPCLSQCPLGINVSVSPGAVLYSRVKAQDVPDIVRQHLGEGKPLRRLRNTALSRFIEF
jgi:NADP-reducing hydrogenase subunit HndC